ncbi:protocadherin gamma-A11-like isoform X7 [Hemiscyllium ocellatum]|uniref:protocadherin gamma-A11-like isoform X7 n=1 Tax=Hemiscyllium ocellatum TaxID=170820 RepID=UPI002966BD3B|nr:protocadherin gamma-A11-like isoform X7 [Hemiscyllium ocellatum]
MGCYQIFWWLNWQLVYCVSLFWAVVSGQIRYSIPEELQPGAFVGNIANDLGLRAKQLTARNFRVVSGPQKQYLEVNLNNGILFVKENIDREQLCGSGLTCMLSLEAVIENPLTVYHLEVEILDVNDNAPSFPNSQFRLKISELAAPGARFALEYAHDPDVGTNSLQTYQLVANEYFALSIDSRGGDGKLPVLVLERPLDREIHSTHQLELIAKDGGIPPKSGTAEIIVVVQDENDNAPAFPNSVYKISLLENAPKGTLVIKLNATDMDDGSNGEVLYSFSSHTSVRVREMFGVDSKTGEVRVKGTLDYEKDNGFEINMQALDQGTSPHPGYCHILVSIIDVNDNAPEVILTSLFSPLSEDSKPGTVVALISVSDRDSGENGQVTCEIANNLPFRLDSSLRNYYRLLSRQPLDRENVSKYDVGIRCSDSGSPPLTARKTIRVEISDINDNAPRFTQTSYTAQVMENNAIGTSIFAVTALDPDLNQNARLSYSILDNQVQNEPVSTFLSINSKNGVIYSQRTFDYEQLRNFQVQIRARDSGEPPLTSNVSVDIIILDQNDHAPVIIHPSMEYGSTALETVSKFAEPGYLVTKVTAMDADSGQNARLSYQILQSTDPGLFTISPDTGEIWTIRGFASKDAKKQRMVVSVNDNGTPMLSATITLILSVVEGDAEMLSDMSNLSQDSGLSNHASFYIVIFLGTISAIFLVVLIALAIAVHKTRNGFDTPHCALDMCCCLQARSSLNGIQKASRNIQIPPNYIEVFGGDPLSQSFRYGTCSTSGSTKGELYSNRCSSSTGKNNISNETMWDQEKPQTSLSNCRNIGEVKQPNADWRFSQTHRAELNSSQYREEEGVQRDIQHEAQREVQCDVQCEAPRDVQCNVPHNIQHEVQRDVPCEVQRVVENEPSGARKPACARPVAIPAGRDGWTLPRTAPRMQLQMTLGPHVPGTLRSQYLIPRELHTSGACISNSSVEFIAPIVGSLHGRWAANQTRDHRGISSSSGRRPELDTQACGQIPGSPSGQRLSTQRLHSRDDHHSLREVNY